MKLFIKQAYNPACVKRSIEVALSVGTTYGSTMETRYIGLNKQTNKNTNRGSLGAA